MRQTGLTSVTFRQLPAEQIIQMAKEAELEGIEWGGDIHVPHGQIETAKRVRRATLEQGLQVLSYGSYYRLGTNSDPAGAFLPVLRTAYALGAGMIRIWAGVNGSASADQDAYNSLAGETKLLCRMAGEYGIRISYEYHPGTLTDCARSTLRLLTLCGDCGIGTYWQPRMIPVEDNLHEIRQIKDFITNIHVFHWERHDGQTIRMPLTAGASHWKTYLDILPEQSPLIMEFVREDAAAQFPRDAEALHGWIRHR